MNYPFEFPTHPHFNGRGKYEPATYYRDLDKSFQDQDNFDRKDSVPTNYKYSSNVVQPNYKGQDIDMGTCSVNNVYFTLPPNPTFTTHLQGPTSASRELYPKVRLPDGQYLYRNLERIEPLSENGKRFLYEAEYQDPIPGVRMPIQRRKLYPLTDFYAREITPQLLTRLPLPDY